ncbi:hypothetical protein BD410DRAFT_810501 [Rickenella mellea]|uniref:Uncharacterized protein n=1 Tax=Rickenella mellea TaxID=50990 RepID=A0A4Y7PDV9_9AGAM|nr:hypothetical protein BD410DRAFT_810501 [Rickenella mellea]
MGQSILQKLALSCADRSSLSSSALSASRHTVLMRSSTRRSLNIRVDWALRGVQEWSVEWKVRGMDASWMGDRGTSEHTFCTTEHASVAKPKVPTRHSTPHPRTPTSPPLLSKRRPLVFQEHSPKLATRNNIRNICCNFVQSTTPAITSGTAYNHVLSGMCGMAAFALDNDLTMPWSQLLPYLTCNYPARPRAVNYGPMATAAS